MCLLVEHRSELFTVNFERIILCQHENLTFRQNETFDRLQKSFHRLERVSGLPDISKLKLDINSREPSLLLIDDLQEQFLGSPEMLHLLSVQVHHFNISVCYTMQNYFAPSKFGKSLSRNVNFKELNAIYNHKFLNKLILF